MSKRRETIANKHYGSDRGERERENKINKNKKSYVMTSRSHT
jgi:hypothetical protein